MVCIITRRPLERDGAVLGTVSAKEGVKQASTQSSLLLAREAKHFRSVGPRSSLVVLIERGTRNEGDQDRTYATASKAGRLAGTVDAEIGHSFIDAAGMELSIPSNNYGVIHQCRDQWHGHRSQFRQSTCGQVQREATHLVSARRSCVRLWRQHAPWPKVREAVGKTRR